MVPRSARFDIQVPLRYRALGAGDWLTGTMANISASGVLFVADAVLEYDTPVQMAFALPTQIATPHPPGRVVCDGRIVRVVSAESPGERAALAATITNYEMMRGNQHSDS